jgi:hypothetical protein
MVTWKIRTVTTKINTLLLGAFVDIAWLSHTHKPDKMHFPFFLATSVTDGLLKRDTQVLGNQCSQVSILLCQIQLTIETI